MNDFGAPFAAHHGDGEPFMADGGDAGTPFTAPGGDGAAFVGYEHIIRSERSLGPFASTFRQIPPAGNATSRTCGASADRRTRNKKHAPRPLHLWHPP